MGINIFKRSSDSISYTKDENTSPNPNKYNFEIIEIYCGDWAHVLLVNYPECTTYAGNKILVVRGEYTESDELDPHFLEDNKIIARFVPTKEGLEMAKDFIGVV